MVLIDKGYFTHMGLSLFFVLVLFLCLVFSAYFSGLETALTSLSTPRIIKLIEEKPSSSTGLSLWLKKPNQILTTILIGNNLVNTLAAASATVLAQTLFANYAISAATFVITILLLIFGEVTPKTLARHNAEKIAPLGTMCLLPLHFLLKPVTFVLGLLTSRLVTIAGGSLSNNLKTSKEDIDFMIRLGNKEGVFDRSDGRMLESVIEFRETIAKESMVPRLMMASFEVNTRYEDVLARVVKEGHTRWPVYEGNIDNIKGIFHAKDLLQSFNGQATKEFSLRTLLRPAPFVPDSMKITSLLKEFQAGKTHMAIVVDEYGGTAGLITLEDVLEEIVGEIRDEYDDEEGEQTIKQLDANNYLVNGRANMADLGKMLSLSFPESETYESLGGFLSALYGSMPKTGTTITFNNLQFTVKAADEKKISLVHIHHKSFDENAKQSSIGELFAA